MRGEVARSAMEGRRGGGGGGGGGGGSNGGNSGWPLGLQPLHLQMSRAREQQHYNHLRFWGDASPFFLSTPSISSLSSSDLDTQSTGSFFHERSTTLGNLIGIHGRTPRNHQPALLDNVTKKLWQSKHMKKTQRLHACWCAFTLVMRCSTSSNNRTNVNPSQDSLSPSLAHLLEIERQAAHSQRPRAATLQCESFDEDLSFEDLDDHLTEIALFDGVGDDSHLARQNTLFNDDGILPPHPSGAPLKSTLHPFATSPSAAAAAASSYLPTDWSANVPIVRKRKHYHAVNGRFHNSLCPSFWKVG